MLLRMRAVAKAFGGVHALRHVDFELEAGEVHALLGENGAGKSTLMRVLSGAHQPDAGEVTLEDRPYRPRYPQEARSRGVAMIYQELNLAPHLSVAQNVVLGREPKFGLGGWAWLRHGAARRRVREALARLGHGDLDLDVPVRELGPGARQRIEIARALAFDARVVVLDEPTSSLGREDTERLFDVIRILREQGVGVVYISHFLEEVAEIADRYTVLRDGESVARGEIHSEGIDDQMQAWIEAMAGRKLDAFFPQVPHEPGEPWIDLSALVEGDLSLRRGEILGIAGLVGAGRSELLRAIYGLLPRDARVAIAGRELGANSPRRAMKRGLGFVAEDRKVEGLALERSIAENLTLSALGPLGLPGFVRHAKRRCVAERWSDALSLRRDHVEQNVGSLSGGNQQKVALARLLHQGADVFLLDEPTRGVDVTSKVEIYRLLGEQAAAGKTIVVVSSYIPELLGICDRIAVMHRGHLGPARPTDSWDAASILAEATRGASASDLS